MGFESYHAPESEHEEPAPRVTPPEKGRLSRLVEKGKTTVGLAAAIAGIGFAEGNFEAQAADIGPKVERRHKLNDYERERHFLEFNKYYTDATRAARKADTREEAEQAAARMDTVIQFLRTTLWKTEGAEPSIDKSYLKTLTTMGELYAELERRFGVSFDAGGRRAAFESVRSIFEMRIEQRAAQKELEKSKRPSLLERLTPAVLTNHSSNRGYTTAGPDGRRKLQPSRGTSGTAGPKSAPRLRPNRSR